MAKNVHGQPTSLNPSQAIDWKSVLKTYGLPALIMVLGSVEEELKKLLTATNAPANAVGGGGGCEDYSAHVKAINEAIRGLTECSDCCLDKCQTV